jgi:hypothetical protein
MIVPATDLQLVRAFSSQVWLPDGKSSNEMGHHLYKVVPPSYKLAYNPINYRYITYKP